MLSTFMLPQELLEEIVDLLFDDHQSLKALACTAHCISARSQKLLFHELVLSPKTKSPSSYIPLLEMSPHILSYVRRLRIVAREFYSSLTSCQYVHDDASLGRLIHAVTNVDDIELMQVVGLDAFIGPGGLLPTIASPRVRMLRLNTVWLPTPQSIFTVLSYFPSVSSLRLQNVPVMGTSLSLDSGNVRLTEMSLSAHMVSSSLCDCLFNNAASGWLRDLQGLVVESYCVWELCIISKLIPQLPNLITLTIKGPMGEEDEEWHPGTQQRLAEEIPVFPLQKIKTLHLSLYDPISSWTGWWLSHLTRGAAINLEHLTVDLMYENARATSEMQHSMAAWKDLETNLMRLPRLKSVNTMTTVVVGR
ncbi:hypothetical protein BDZ89DRAFT_1063956 [Hymenopellis radicata]|nr:hypothetical protein BDZ89DRAFT_1063956 [Hymenopellis radicata]